MGNRAEGVAYHFWRKVEKGRIDRGLTKIELAKLSGISRPTIDNLRTGSGRPAVKTVHALADVLHIDRDEAEVLAGLLPPHPEPARDSAVRTAILNSTAYTEEQRTMLLSMVDVIDQANRVGRESGISEGKRAI